MKNALYTLGVSILLGTVLIVGYVCFLTVKQFDEARARYEQNLMNEAHERFHENTSHPVQED